MASVPVPQTQVDLLVLILKIATRVGRPMRALVAEPEGLSVIELRVLMALGGEGALAGHELAAFISMPAMNISRALAALTAAGLVEQVADPANRRRKPHRLSEAGEACFERLFVRMEEVADFAFAPLSDADRKRIGPMLAKLDEQLHGWDGADGVSQDDASR